MRRRVLDRALSRPDRAAIRTVVLAGDGTWKCLPRVDAALHPNVPPFFVAESVRRILDFLAGWHRGLDGV